MKAIYQNTQASIYKGLDSAPRAQRAQWMLLVQVGTQNISPFAWSLESGSLNAACGIIRDLLVIRADRDNYYYGMNELFLRHPDVVKRLATEAPALLNDLFDGLLWRSSVTVNGTRRVNYYAKFILLTAGGKFAKTLEWIRELANPKIVVHPILAVCADLAWGRLAYRKFFLKKSWVLFTLLLFVCSQSLMFQHNRGSKGTYEHYLQFSLRVLVYVLGMGELIWTHAAKIGKSYVKGMTVKLFGHIPIPDYLENAMDLVQLLLTISLIVMFATEPILHCAVAGHGDFTSECDSEANFFPYSVFCMFSMILYYVSLLDLAVFHTRVCAFGLACFNLLGEVALFLIALSFLTLTFGCALNCLSQDVETFGGPPAAALTLFEVFLRMMSAEVFDEFNREWTICIGVFVFMFAAFLFIFNMLIAQLCCAYDKIYADMVGMARLYRFVIIVDIVPTVSDSLFAAFTEGMAFEKKLEFNAGDVGLPGGIQILEPSNANPTNKDAIVRFGGSTDTNTPWPATEAAEVDADKLERLEKAVQKALQKASTKVRGGGVKSSKATGSSMGAGTTGSSGAGSGQSQD